MYKFEIKSEENIVLITFQGLLSQGESDKVFEDISKKLKTFNTSRYNLVVDTKELKASNQDCVDNIKRTIELLVKTPFKGRYNIVPKSIITGLQAKRVSGSDAFSKITPIKSYESVLDATVNL